MENKSRPDVLADRGQGILATLGRVDQTLKTHAQALTTAFTKIISGRSSEARGNGLKFVKRIVVSHPIKLFFQTGNASLSLSEKENKVDIETSQEHLQGCLAIIKY